MIIITGSEQIYFLLGAFRFQSGVADNTVIVVTPSGNVGSNRNIAFKANNRSITSKSLNRSIKVST